MFTTSKLKLRDCVAIVKSKKSRQKRFFMKFYKIDERCQFYGDKRQYKNRI